jgi:nucleoid DNA-binding protein
MGGYRACYTTSQAWTSTTPALEIIDLEKSQGGIPAMDPNQKWEIRNIVGRKTVGDEVQHSVEWETTWMRESDLSEAKELIEEFVSQLLKRGQQRAMSGFNASAKGERKKRRGRPPKRTKNLRL